MNKQIEALKMAIEALENAKDGIWSSDSDIAIQACKKALAEAENPELVAVQYLYKADPDNPEMIPLYTHPATWQGLSYDEITQLKDDWGIDIDHWNDFAHAIEQALKEKNHG